MNQSHHLFIVPSHRLALEAADHLIASAKDSIDQRGAFFIALSGGSTPKAIFNLLKTPSYQEAIDWSKVYLFWGDERPVPPTDAMSNYHMAMKEGWQSLPVPQTQIFRIEGEKEPQKAAEEYNTLLMLLLPEHRFDLVMLGMGSDGHTASLFPHTKALQEKHKWVVANWVQKLDTWRLTLTYPIFDKARSIAIYVTGEGKKNTLKNALEGPYQPDELPIQRIGHEGQTTTWFVDEAAAKELSSFELKNIKQQ